MAPTLESSRAGVYFAPTGISIVSFSRHILSVWHMWPNDFCLRLFLRTFVLCLCRLAVATLEFEEAALLYHCLLPFVAPTFPLCPCLCAGMAPHFTETEIDRIQTQAAAQKTPAQIHTSLAMARNRRKLSA